MPIRGIVACFLIAVWLGAAPAQAIPEVEPNETIQDATIVPSPDVADGDRESSSDIDTFRFTGLIADTDYVAFLDNGSLGLGWFANDGTPLGSAAFEGVLELDVVADGSGEVVLAVCGYQAVTLDFDCTPTSQGGGDYRLSLPEPGPGALALTALSLVALLRLRARQRQLA